MGSYLMYLCSPMLKDFPFRYEIVGDDPFWLSVPELYGPEYEAFKWHHSLQ